MYKTIWKIGMTFDIFVKQNTDRSKDYFRIENQYVRKIPKINIVTLCE